ncbi:MAG: hypothetical protein JRG82_03620 [Deltaproteobacteria bacterium]|nr:hypothetical protein [Deltaproteobacteria bacterium]
MSPGVRLRAVLLPLCGVLAAGPVLGAEFDRGDFRMELNGSVKSLYTFTRTVTTEDFVEALPFQAHRSDSWGLLTRARIEAEGAWKDKVSAQFVYDNEMRNGTFLDSLGLAVAEQIGTQTWLNWDRTYSVHSDAHWRHSIYRAWVRFEGDGVELTLGRQRIALGRGRLWNPEDLFNPIFPLAIESDQRIGQDAAVGRVRLADSLWASAIWSPQDDPDEHRMAGRVDYEAPALDAGVMVGRFRKDWVVGADFASNLGDAAIRGEATYTDLDRGGHVWQTVASIDYNFDVGNGVYAVVEYLYNEHTFDSLEVGSPAPPFDSDRVIRAIARGQLPLLDRITTVNEHQTGIVLSYEFHPLLTGSAVVLYDWNGASAAFAPSLSFSPWADLVISVGGQLFVGRADEKNDFGDTPGLLILSVEAYF